MSFLKVKRKYEEDPKEFLILASKKHKLQDISDHVPIFELAQSLVKEEDINDVIAKTIKDVDIKTPKCNLEKLRAHIRENNKNQTKNDRYRLFAAARKLDDSTSEQEAVPVIDVLDDGTTESKDHGESVYDIYYSSTDIDVTDPDFISNHVLHEISDDYDWDGRFESEDEANGAPDEDDSNDEDNWRNDYPDEESSDDDSDGALWVDFDRVRFFIPSSSSSSDDDESDYHEDYYDEVVTGGSDSNDES